MMLSFIILTWNSAKYLNKCFDSLIAKCLGEQLEYEVIVVDNGSVDETLSILDTYSNKIQGKIHVIKLERNRGTTYPRNLALRIARGSHICVLDSDTEFGTGSLCGVLDRLQNSPEIGIIAPRLLLENGSVQNSVKLFPTFWDKLIKVPAVFLKRKVYNADFYKDFPFQQPREVDSAISACWIFKRELLKSIGYFDEKIFYSPEDLDYCFRVHKSGKLIVYDPNLTLLHHTQQISHRKPLSRVSLSHFKGLIYYYRKHGGWISRPQL
jgi:GT2 family glycosyltransferase